ncbi:NLRC3 [Branchiostoma lanceolatum]|uniref:NLRC3 protein n=1 Tax=Branchiostoma lanceolatum TaxID=7740 RepID=A0A8J9ZL44_BRALA|nr:NLRC3 [Branchiostoma lanceolatum]
MTENANMEVSRTKAIGDLGVKDGETVTTPEAKVEKNPPLLQKEGVERKRASVQKSPSWADDDLDRLYESRKTAVFPPAVDQPIELPPQPADVSCRLPEPLYVRRVGQRFWSTKRILDWQRQALHAREDPEAALKPVREYGEESALKKADNGEAGLRGLYENNEEHGHYENDGEHRHYENYGEHGPYKNNEEHKYYQYDKHHTHYENGGEHGHYENDGEHGHYENDGEHGHYENDGEHGHYENDGEHGHYENDGEHGHYENDDEQSNLSTHVYADLDADFLAAQDAIRDAEFQPFYEMDISPADGEQKQPFYKMDVTAAKDKQKEGKPFYEMKVASADDKNERQIFYDMDDNQLGRPTSDDAMYADLDAEFVAAQDAVCMRHRTREGSKEGGDDPRGSQNCREFFRSGPGCMLAVCVGVIIAVTAAVVVAVIFGRLRFHPTVPDLTTLPTTSTTSPALLSATSPATSKATDHWTEWTLYIREYFQQDSDAATGLEERYPDNEVVMALLEDRFFWYWVCRYWEHRTDLPPTLSDAVTYCIQFGTSSKNMESHGFATYREFLSSMLDALEALPNTTETLQNSHYRHYPSLSLSGVTLSDNDVEALAKLFPYLRGMKNLFLANCGLSLKAATSMAGRLHLLHTLNGLVLRNNKIGDDGLEAISRAFPHLKELKTFNVVSNSITDAGGRAMANRLVHLQELQDIHLAENELALSLSSLAKAFVNMTRLQSVGLWPITCRRASFRMAAQQVHDAVHTLGGQVRTTRSGLLYDASTGSRGGTRELDTAWQRVKQELTAGVYISKRQMKMALEINLLEE